MNVARGVRDLSIPLESSGVTHLKLEIMCDVTGYIYVTQKKKKKPTSTGERNQTKKKKKKGAKNAKRRNPNPDSINQPTTGKNISTIIVWLPGKLHTQRKDMIMRSTSLFA